MNIQNKLPFLDVLVEHKEEQYHTTVYKKPTNAGLCLNGNSQCTETYKMSVISSYVNRAYKTTKTWKDFDQEIRHIKQTLVNNDYSNTIIDEYIKKFLTNKQREESNNEQLHTTYLDLYYKSQYHENYKTDERIMREIINTNIKSTKSGEKVRLIIYYKSKKTSNLVIKNNPKPTGTDLQQTNVIYEFSCPLSHGDATSPRKYIGMTTTTLSRRLTHHLQKGSIKEHYQHFHQQTITRQEIVKNTKIHRNDHYHLEQTPDTPPTKGQH